MHRRRDRRVLLGVPGSGELRLEWACGRDSASQWTIASVGDGSLDIDSLATTIFSLANCRLDGGAGRHVVERRVTTRQVAGLRGLLTSSLASTTSS